MQDAIILPDKRAALLNAFLQNYQQGRATDVQSQDAQQRNAILQQQADDARTQRNQALLEALAKADPTTRQRFMAAAQAHPEVFGNIQLPSFAPSDSEAASAAAHGFQRKQAEDVQGGSLDPQARNSVNQLLYQQQLTEPAMKDVSAQRLGQLQPPSGNGTDMSMSGMVQNPAPNTNTPSADSYVNALRRDTGDLTTAGQNLQSQTQIKQTGMNIAAEAPVRAAQAAAERAQAREATSRAIYQEAKNKMLAGDPSAPNIYAKGVITNPQSYFGLTPEEKGLAGAGLGGKIPKKLTDYETRRLDAAENGMAILGDVKSTVEKWQQRGYPITGPAIGRYNSATNKWGDQLIPMVPPQFRDEYMSDIAAVQENLTANVLQEAASIIGSRPAYQVVEMLYNTSPSLSKGKAAMSGALDNMMHRYQVAADQMNRRQWGGDPPTLTGSTDINPNGGGNIISTPDGLKWRKNPDGSMTQVP